MVRIAFPLRHLQLTSITSCKDCIIAYIAACTERREEGRCPSCSQGPIKENELIEVLRPKTEDEMKTALAHPGDDKNPEAVVSSAVELRRNDFRSSTKLDALIQNLREWSFGHSAAGDDWFLT